MKKRNGQTYLPNSANFRKEEFPFYWIAHVHGVYTSEMETILKPLGLDIPTWRVLFFLKEREPLTVSDIAKAAVSKLSTIIKILARMKADRLIVTSIASYDRRVTEVQLTERGRKAISDIEQSTGGMFERTFKDVSPSQIQKLNALLQMLLANMSEPS